MQTMVKEHFMQQEILGGRKNKKTIWMHRLIIGTPVGMFTDHIDHNGLNNQKSNLRICTTLDNSRNSLSRKNSTSKYKGVSICSIDYKYLSKKTGKIINYSYPNKWMAQIVVNKIHVYIGRFDTEEEAARAYDKKAIEAFSEFACINFPLSDYI
jgi:hypothetical protein